MEKEKKHKLLPPKATKNWISLERNEEKILEEKTSIELLVGPINLNTNSLVQITICQLRQIFRFLRHLNANPRANKMSIQGHLLVSNDHGRIGLLALSYS